MPLLPFNGQAFPGIFIDDAVPGFFSPVAAALRDLAKLQIGHELLTIISKRTRGIGSSGTPPVTKTWNAPIMKEFKCVIRRGPGTLVGERIERTGAYGSLKPDVALTDDMSNSDTVAVLPAAMGRLKTNGSFTLPGPRYSAVALVEPTANYTQVMEGLATPLYVALGHELIHCMHFLSGDIHASSDAWGAKDHPTLHEEARTVGLGIYAHARISENAIRKEARLDPRTYYDTAGDCDGLTSAFRPVPGLKPR